VQSGGAKSGAWFVGAVVALAPQPLARYWPKRSAGWPVGRGAPGGARRREAAVACSGAAHPPRARKQPNG